MGRSSPPSIYFFLTGFTPLALLHRARSISAREHSARLFLVPQTGQSPYFDLMVEKVHVKALVDSGSQSTIVSRAFLHKIGWSLREAGKPLPKLSMPTARLYGKDGKSGNQELNITAQVELVFSAGNRSVRVPTFVQLGSAHECLLGNSRIGGRGVREWL